MLIQIDNLIARLRRRVRSERGFSMLPSMSAVFAGSLISMGAWTAAHSDVKLQEVDRYQKRAFTAAQTGLSDYVQHLSADTGYWTYCDQPPNSVGQGALNDQTFGQSGHLNRRWLPDGTDESLTWQYSIDLMPTNGYSACVSNSNRTLTMVDQNNGTFKIRVTGRSGPPVPNTATINPDPRNPGNYVAKSAASIRQWRELRWKRRSVVVDFRRRGFLDYAYFTDLEGFDPILQPDPTWASSHCNIYYRDGRDYWNGSSSSRPECWEIQFGSSDWIKGPFHTNDAIYVRSGAKFGNPGKNDRIEISAPSPCHVRDAAHGGCGRNYGTYYGPLLYGSNAPELVLPEANEDLAVYGETANGGKTYSGRTTIVLNGTTMNVTNADVNGGVTMTNQPYPTSGVIYVKKKPGCVSFNAANNYHFPAACGSVEVEGTYSQPLTIAAENDVILTDDVKRHASAQEATLGLVANEFVRVRHYISGDSAGTIGNVTSCTNSGGKRVNEIEAAVLALQHSFLVDNYRCGGSLGTLKITGAVSQKYRGAVGTSGGTGYTKDYNYDYRLRYIQPPYFLTPSLSSWRISRYREQVPACTCDE